MFDPHAHLQFLALSSDLRENALQRPRLDRPEHRRHGRVRRLVESMVHAPERAALDRDDRVPSVTIRTAVARDYGAIARLAELNERRLPSGLVLVGEVESDILAALPLVGGPILSDLMRPTADVVQLLELRSGQLTTADLPRPAA